MSYLKTPDVLDIIGPIGISVKQFRGWCERGRVSPIEGGHGHGSHRLFTVLQAVSIVVAARVFTSDRGCAPGYVDTVIGAFGAVPEAWLRDEFAAGRTHLQTVQDGRPVLQEPQYRDQVDVQAAYRAVRVKVAELARETARC